MGQTLRSLLLAAAIGGAPCWAQKPSAPANADPNAFPEAQSEAAAQKAAGQGAPAPPANQPKSTAADNPFPQAQSEAAAKQAAADQKADDAASGAGAAPGGDAGDSSSSRDKFKGLDLLGENDSRISNGTGGVVHNPKLALDDIKVGQQYQAEGNYAGAYARFKEATAVDPDNADAVFLLAEAARKSTHLDEAAANYKLYLAAAPNGGKAKQARKALAQLEGK
jgi:tetratricopeptide (TPR) repeat protein